MDFNKNKLIEKTIDKYMNTWSYLIDTEDFVKEKYLDKIDSLIYKNLKKKLKEINIYYLLYLESKGVKLSLFQKMSISFSGLRSVYEMEERELVLKQKHKQEQQEKQKGEKVVKE